MAAVPLDTPNRNVYIKDIHIDEREFVVQTTTEKLLVRFRESDNRFGVTRETLAKLAHELGLNETQVIHYALSQLAIQLLPTYAPDDGPLTARELKVIAKLAGGRQGNSIRSSLF